MMQVLERLLVSSLSEANDQFFLARNEVQAILYFGEGGMFSEEYKLYHRPTGKGGKLSQDQLEDGISFLRESLRAGRKVLAAGPTGVTIVAAYLCEMGMGLDQAVTMVSGRDVPPPDTTMLDRHEVELKRRAAVRVHT
jgi:hypothetical protein